MQKRIFTYIAIFISCGLLFYSYKSEQNALVFSNKANSEKKSKSFFNSANAAIAGSNAGKVESPIYINKYCSDIASFLAGQKLDQSSELYKYTSDSSWINYQKNLAGTWNAFYHEKL